MKYYIEKGDRWVAIIATLAILFAISIIIFCVPNWMKPGNEVNWLWVIPMGMVGSSLIIYVMFLIIRGIAALADLELKR